MQAEANLSDTNSTLFKELKTVDIIKNKNRKLKKFKNKDDDDEMRGNSDLENEKSSMSSSSSDSSSSISFSSSSSESCKAKRKNRNRKKAKASSSESSSDTSSSLSLSSSELSFSDSESESIKAREQNLEEGEIDEPEPKSSQINITHGIEQLKRCKSEISRIKKKIKSIEREIRNLSKKLKQHPSSKKSKQKKKLEKKLLTYKDKINGLISRKINLLSKYPHIDDHLSPKRRQKSKKKSSKKKESKKSPTSSNQVKIPYPVLNDKREMELIKEILEEKQQNLNEMFSKTCQTLDQNQSAISSQDEEDKRARLVNLKESIRIQLQRLNRQLEYVRINLEIQNFEKKLTIDHNLDHRNEINHRLSDLRKINETMISQMKEANRKYLQSIENKEGESKVFKSDPKSELSSVTVSANPVSYRQIATNQMAPKVQNLNSMTPPTSSASSSSSSSSINTRAQQSFPRSQVRTPPLPNHQSFQNQPNFPRFAKINNRNDDSHLESFSDSNSQLHRANNSHVSTSPQNQNSHLPNTFKNNRNFGNNYGNQMPNFENMFQNPHFIQSMMNVANDEAGNGLLPCPQKSRTMNNEGNQKNPMFGMFEQYFKKFASGMGLGNMSQSQVYSLFETMQQNGNFSFANQMMMTPQMNNNHFNSNRQSNNSRFNINNNNSNFNSNKQNFVNEFRFNKRNNSNLDSCQNKRQKF